MSSLLRIAGSPDLLILSLLFSAGHGRELAQESFNLVPHEIASGLRGGYQLIAADLNRDGRPDLVAVASGLTEVVWFENPGWQRHVLLAGIRAPINVAAADLDGDGIPELALAHGFATAAAQSVGNLTLLTHGADVRQPWTARELDRVPTSHRVRFARVGVRPNEHWLVNAPLIGDSLRAPDYRGNTSIYFYRPPEWRRELLSSEEQGVIHAIEVLPTQPGRIFPAGIANSAPALRVATAGFLGVSYYNSSVRTANAVTRVATTMGSTAPWPLSGASEIAFPEGVVNGSDASATIEPWHGNNLVVYIQPRSGGTMQRVVVDSTLADAHTLVVADFDGDGRDELVAGERGGQRSVKVYRADATARTWARTTLDAGGMAAAGCAVADFNMDGRVDLACIGTATANLKWYENVKR